MSSLAKLTIKTVSRQSKLSPVEARRNKLLAGINEQFEVAEAAMRGEQYSVTVPRWTKNDAGEKVRVQRQKVVRSWFFERDGGVYIQCKYGSKALPLSKDGNAVFVKQIADVKGVLETLRAAAQNGELDSAIEMTISNLKR
jgi:trehalose utilization protein